MQQWTLSTLSALMDYMEHGAVSTVPLQPLPLGLTSALWIHTGLVTFSTQTQTGAPSPIAQRHPAGHVPGQHQSLGLVPEHWVMPRQSQLTTYTATKPSGAVGNHCLPKPCSAPAGSLELELVLAAAASIRLGLPLRKALARRLARSGCLFGVSK